MNSYAFPARDITNDFLAVKGIAATRTRNHQIINAAYNYRIITQADKPFDRSNATASTRLFLFVELLKLLSPKIFRDDVAWNQLSISDAGEEIFHAPITVLTGDAFHFVVAIAKEFFG